jgi:predicted transcriptional regulator
MLLTFGLYHTLTATVKPVTPQELMKTIPFDDLMISYYVAVLFANGLIERVSNSASDTPYYQLTEAGLDCIQEYEQQNPSLSIKRLYTASMF